jgi:hypothetical protein
LEECGTVKKTKTCTLSFETKAGNGTGNKTMIEDPNIRPHDQLCDIITIQDHDSFEDRYWVKYPIAWNFEQHKTQPWKIGLFIQWSYGDTPDIPERVGRMVRLSEVAALSNGFLPVLFVKTCGLTIDIYKFNTIMDFRLSPNLHTCSGGPWAPSYEMYSIEFKCLYFEQMVKQNYGIRWNGKEIKPQ